MYILVSAFLFSCETRRNHQVLVGVTPPNAYGVSLSICGVHLSTKSIINYSINNYK